jgi:hypothetical protein
MRFAGAAATVLATVIVPILLAGAQAPPPDDWRGIEGSWTASGPLRTLSVEGGRTASTTYLSGAVVLTGTVSGASRGFKGEAITFNDGTGVGVGRAVWTDERGDRIFSRLNGDAMRAGRHIVATITGGTGRYAGIEGEFAFEWQYVVQAEDGTVQGHAVGLKGRFRVKGDAR